MSDGIIQMTCFLVTLDKVEEMAAQHGLPPFIGPNGLEQAGTFVRALEDHLQKEVDLRKWKFVGGPGDYMNILVVRLPDETRGTDVLFVRRWQATQEPVKKRQTDRRVQEKLERAGLQPQFVAVVLPEDYRRPFWSATLMGGRRLW